MEINVTHMDEAIQDQGIEFEQARLESAAAAYDQLRPAILELRKVPLSFTEPVWEPASALVWIERGGEN